MTEETVVTTYPTTDLPKLLDKPARGPLACTVKQENFKAALAAVSKALPSKNIMPVLSFVLIASDGDRLRLSATNLEITITTWIGALIETPGSVAIPAKTLSDLVATMRAGDVSLRLNQRTQTIFMTGVGIKSNIKGLDADEFPIIHGLNPDRALEFDTEVWRRAIDRVSFAAATDEARPIMASVAIEITGNRARLCATDGFRLAVETIPLKDPVLNPVTLLVPAKSLAEANKVLDPDDPLLMDVSYKGAVVMQNGPRLMSCQLLEGEFPRYDAILPQQWDTRLVVSTDALRNVVKSVDIIAREINHTARFQMSPGGNDTPGMIVATAVAEFGDNMAETEAVVDGHAIQIAFNTNFFLQGLGVVSLPQVSLEMTTAIRPAVLRPVGDDGYFYVLMPMQIKEPKPAEAKADARPEPVEAR